MLTRSGTVEELGMVMEDILESSEDRHSQPGLR